MSKITKLYYKDREEWMSLRTEVSGKNSDTIYRIGASDAAAICGYSKYKSPLRCFYEALGMVQQNKESLRMSLGLISETTNLACYQAFHPDEETFAVQLKNREKANKVNNANFIAINEDFPYIFASLDFQRPSKQPALVSSEMFSAGEVIPFSYPIDAKNISYQYWASCGKKLPKTYFIQAQCQMLAMDVKYAEMATKIEDSDYQILPVIWDDFTVEVIKEKVMDFCKRVVTAKPLAKLWHEAKLQLDYESMSLYEDLISNLQPDPIGMEDDVDVLEEITRSEVDDSLIGTELCELHYDRYKKALRVEKIAKRIKDKVKAYFVDNMRGYKYVKFGGHNGKVSHYQKSDGKFYWSVK